MFSVGGSKAANEFSFAVPSAQDAEFFLPSDPPIIFAISTLVTGFLCSYALVCRFYSGSCSSQKVTCVLGDPKCLEVLICFYEQFPGYYYSFLLALPLIYWEGL